MNLTSFFRLSYQPKYVLFYSVNSPSFVYFIVCSALLVDFLMSFVPSFVNLIMWWHIILHPSGFGGFNGVFVFLCRILLSLYFITWINKHTIKPSHYIYLSIVAWCLDTVTVYTGVVTQVHLRFNSMTDAVQFFSVAWTEVSSHAFPTGVVFTIWIRTNRAQISSFGGIRL